MKNKFLKMVTATVLVSAVAILGGSYHNVNVNTITAYADEYDDEETPLDRILYGEGSVSDYASIGVSGVTETNLEDVNYYVYSNDCETKSQAKSYASKMVTALKTINAGTTVLSYYQTVGIDTEDVTSDYTPFIKSAVLAAKSEKGENLTADEIYDAFYEGIDTLDTIMSDISSGCGEIEEYQALGITTVTPILLDDVNMYESYHDCETIAQIKNNAATLIKALKAVNAGTTVISNYEKLEIYDVDKSNVAAVKKAILKQKKAMGRNLTISEIEDVIYNLDI